MQKGTFYNAKEHLLNPYYEFILHYKDTIDKRNKRKVFFILLLHTSEQMVISPDLVYRLLNKTVILFLRMGIYTLRITVFTVMFFVIKSWQKKPR